MIEPHIKDSFAVEHNWIENLSKGEKCWALCMHGKFCHDLDIYIILGLKVKSRWNFFIGLCTILEKSRYKYVEQLNNMKCFMINDHTKYYRLKTNRVQKSRPVMWSRIVMKRLHRDGGLELDHETWWEFDSHI